VNKIYQNLVTMNHATSLPLERLSLSDIFSLEITFVFQCVKTRFLIKSVSENFDFFTYRYDINNDVIEVKINSGVHLSFTIIHQSLLNKLNI
jgi:hypothetical protein